jgi:hypothetical protein
VKIIYETHEEAATRHKRNADADKLLRRMDDEERARFPSVTAMLSWYFALHGHMESAPGMDPSREVIQGLRVDKDERHYWMQSVRQALAELVRAQGNATGYLLLVMHLRPRAVIKYKTKKGMRIPVWADPVPLWELYQHPKVKLSQRKAIELYWHSLEQVEDYAANRGWVAGRAERKSKATQSYRRRRD